MAEPTSYQRVVTATDYDASAHFYYLAANGVNTWMQTNSIDFTGTDKVTVFAGVRKLSDAATGMLAELSASSSSNNGSFHIETRTSGAYLFRSRGTTARDAQGVSGPASPATNILTATGDISGDSAIVRTDRVQTGQNTGDQGAGNYGNYPLFLFRRAGTNLPFNGHFYGAVIRGALCTDPQIAAMERWLALRTGVSI